MNSNIITLIKYLYNTNSLTTTTTCKILSIAGIAITLNKELYETVDIRSFLIEVLKNNFLQKHQATKPKN
jgi:hypothetical protein